MYSEKKLWGGQVEGERGEREGRGLRGGGGGGGLGMGIVYCPSNHAQLDY